MGNFAQEIKDNQDNVCAKILHLIKKNASYFEQGHQQGLQDDNFIAISTKIC